MAVMVGNRQWSVEYDEQENNLTIVPTWDNAEARSMTITGGQAKELAILIQAAMQLPSGDNTW